MAKESFRVSYAGSALEDGTMDVRDLAPALLGIGELCSRANALVNGDRASVTVRIQAQPQTGSVQAILELWQSIPEAIQTVLLDKALVHAKELLAILGFAVSNPEGRQALTNVIEVIKWLGGRLPRKTKDNKDGTITIENHRGDTTTIATNVYNVAGDVHIHADLRQVVKPLEKEGIDRFTTLDEGREVVATITKGDLPALVGKELIQEEVILTSSSPRALEVVRPAFDDSLVWTLQGGPGERINARMGDADFQEQLERNEVSFTKGDVIKVDLETITTRTDTGLHARHEIKKVSGLIHPWQQSGLFVEPEGDPKSPPSPTAIPDSKDSD